MSINHRSSSHKIQYPLPIKNAKGRINSHYFGSETHEKEMATKLNILKIDIHVYCQWDSLSRGIWPDWVQIWPNSLSLWLFWLQTLNSSQVLVGQIVCQLHPLKCSPFQSNISYSRMEGNIFIMYWQQGWFFSQRIHFNFSSAIIFMKLPSRKKSCFVEPKVRLAST